MPSLFSGRGSRELPWDRNIKCLRSPRNSHVREISCSIHDGQGKFSEQRNLGSPNSTSRFFRTIGRRTCTVAETSHKPLLTVFPPLNNVKTNWKRLLRFWAFGISEPFSSLRRCAKAARFAQNLEFPPFSVGLTSHQSVEIPTNPPTVVLGVRSCDAVRFLSTLRTWCVHYLDSKPLSSSPAAVHELATLSLRITLGSNAQSSKKLGSHGKGASIRQPQWSIREHLIPAAWIIGMELLPCLNFQLSQESRTVHIGVRLESLMLSAKLQNSPDVFALKVWHVGHLHELGMHRRQLIS